MQAGLVIKISGEKGEIKDLLEFLEAGYELRRVSRFLSNKEEWGFHVFADLKPRRR